MHTDAIGFLLVLVAIRLAAGLLPRLAVGPRQSRTWLPHCFATIVGALTARGVASGVLAPPTQDASESSPEAAQDSCTPRPGHECQLPGDKNEKTPAPPGMLDEEATSFCDRITAPISTHSLSPHPHGTGERPRDPTVPRTS